MQLYIGNIGRKKICELDLPRVIKQCNSIDAGLVSQLIDEIALHKHDRFVIEQNIALLNTSIGAVGHQDIRDYLSEIVYDHIMRITYINREIATLDQIIDSTLVT